MDEGYVQVAITSITDRLAKNVKFLQPLYEAILNSLEAGAQNIDIEFKHTSNLIDDRDKIVGFSISDDGVGFTQKNIDAFSELWTKNKVDIGCKGSGRFTWLSVFENIKIESYLKDEGVKVFIPFSKSFKKEDVVQEATSVDIQKTIITFTNITKQFYQAETVTERGIDKRFIADI